MSDDPSTPSPSAPPEVCLLLRAHAEQRWLSREVIPVLRQLETREHLPEEQLGAALAYLEVIWVEALQRAMETHTAHARLDEADGGDESLHRRARHYHAAVQSLRLVVAGRVSSLVAVPADAAHSHAQL
jgi:hypothetical protein